MDTRGAEEILYERVWLALKGGGVRKIFQTGIYQKKGITKGGGL